MNIRKGWIKSYRRDIDDLAGLTDPEYRYFQISFQLAIWDRKNKLFGTFDARTGSMGAALPNWSTGKVNSVKNSLISKGFYKKLREHRLGLANPKYLFAKTKEAESWIHNSEKNIHLHENDIQHTETVNADIRDDAQKLASNMAPPWHRNSTG